MARDGLDAGMSVDGERISSAPAAPLGAILAGGASRRFGSPKALATVAGHAIIERVGDALAEAVDRVVLITNDPGLYAGLHLPTRPVERPGAGPLAGLQTALRWAMDEGRAGALVVACDMPFLDPRALRLLVDGAATAASQLDAAAFGAAGDGARPPLCAYFAVSCLPAVERALAGEDRSVRALLASVATAWVPAAEVARFRDPAAMFFNVNTPDDLRHAERIARELDERA